MWLFKSRVNPVLNTHKKKSNYDAFNYDKYKLQNKGMKFQIYYKTASLQKSIYAEIREHEIIGINITDYKFIIIFFFKHGYHFW